MELLDVNCNVFIRRLDFSILKCFINRFEISKEAKVYVTFILTFMVLHLFIEAFSEQINGLIFI